MEKTMASFLQSGRHRRNGSAALHNIEATIEDQIASLQDEIASLTKMVGKSSRKQSEKLTAQAASGYEDLVARSEDLLRDLQDGYLRGASEVRDTVRRHPVATIGAAAAFGLVVALLARR
jgi:ElaB/YqjD/DUF883 family membrane-anchored ribosome-binding protein